MITYEFVQFTADFDCEFGRLFSEEGFERSSDYLTWAFRSTPGQGWLAVARDDDRVGRIIGVLAAVPTPLRANECKLSAFQAVDLLIDPTYRGRGIFAALGRVLLEGIASIGGSLVWGFPNESAAHAWFERLGWIRLGPVPYMFRPLRTGFLLARIRATRNLFNLRLVSRPRPVPGLSSVNRFGPGTDRLWEAFSKSGICAIDRSAAWMNWRVFERPGANYRTVGVYEGNQILAFVTSTIAPRFGASIHHVLEALCCGPKNNRLLLRILQHEVALAAERGADGALCWCPSAAPNRGVYLRAGFVPVPQQFRPAKTYVGLKPLSAIPATITSQNAWYFSLLDFDGL